MYLKNNRYIFPAIMMKIAKFDLQINIKIP